MKKIGFLLLILTLSFQYSFANQPFWFVYDLLDIHVKIGEHQEVSPILNPEDLYGEMQAMDAQLNVDLVGILERSSNKRIIVDTYLYETDQLLRQAQYYQTQLSSNISSLNEKVSQCNSDVSRYNQDFSLAYANYNKKNADQAIDYIIQAKVCVDTYSTLQKVDSIYLERINSLSVSLKKEYDYILENKTTILTYFDLMKPQLLRELYGVSVTLQNNFDSGV